MNTKAVRLWNNKKVLNRSVVGLVILVGVCGHYLCEYYNITSAYIWMPLFLVRILAGMLLFCAIVSPSTTLHAIKIEHHSKYVKYTTMAISIILFLLVFAPIAIQFVNTSVVFESAYDHFP